jgi:hypothetical protein
VVIVRRRPVRRRWEAVRADRERIWAEEVALVLKFAEFEAAAGWQIPVVVLERVQARVATPP